MPREKMERTLSDSGRYELVASLNGADIAILKCCQQQVDLILMDVCTSGNKDGIKAAAEIKAKFPKIRIIIVTSMVEVSYLERARAAGVDSFWYKDISPESLIDVIDRTMAGERLFPGETSRVKLGLAESTELTSKKIEVLRLICDGLEYDEIAAKLNIAERTVKYHISNILSKTGYANRTRLAIAVTNKNFTPSSLVNVRSSVLQLYSIPLKPSGIFLPVVTLVILPSSPLTETFSSVSLAVTT